MSMGRRPTQQQPQLWVPTTDLPRSPGHVFYDKLNQLLHQAAFDRFAEDLCRQHYADGIGRDSIPQASSGSTDWQKLPEGSNADSGGDAATGSAGSTPAWVGEVVRGHPAKELKQSRRRLGIIIFLEPPYLLFRQQAAISACET